jgi:hypothetical protein
MFAILSRYEKDGKELRYSVSCRIEMNLKKKSAENATVLCQLSIRVDGSCSVLRQVYRRSCIGDCSLSAPTRVTPRKSASDLSCHTA